jgi:tetratricopeptide (TPR) repeat protein
MIRLPILILLAACAWAGEPTRAEQEARALNAVVAMPDGAKREAGLKSVHAAWLRFREGVAAAAQAPVADETPRLAELRQRGASLASLRQMAGEQGPAAVAALVEGHLERWPLDDEARTLLGLGRLAAGDRDGALAALIAVLACDPTAGAARELRGRLALGDSDPVVLDRAAADLAPVTTPLLDAGCAAVAAGDATAAGRALAALEPLAKAVRGPLAEAKLAALRAAAAERGEAWPRALELWRAAAAGGVAQPAPAPRIRALVRRLRHGNVEAAITAGDPTTLGELSSAFPERDDLQDRLFRLLLGRGQLAAARDAARALLEADPAHPLGLLINDGTQASLDPRRLDVLPPFVARLRQATPQLGQRFPVLYGLDAALCEAAGDVPGALAALAPLLAAHPEDRDARWQHARLSIQAGDISGAIADCNLLLASQPDDLDALALRGRARAAGGDRAGALADIDLVVAVRPGCPAWLARARVHRQLEDAAGVAADLASLIEAAQEAVDSLALLDAIGLTADPALQKRLLEKASQLGNAEATQRLRRLR